MKNTLQTSSWDLSNDMMHADFNASEEMYPWEDLDADLDMAAELSDLEEWEDSDEWDTDFGGLF